MKYIEFKTFLESISTGGNNIPTDDKLKPILLQSLREVATKCEPLSLMSIDIEENILQTIEDGLFIRVPNIPNNDDDIIDTDETLVYAVGYLVASKIANGQRKMDFSKLSDGVISDYYWQRYKDIDSGKYNKDISLIKNSINIHGYKNIYISRVRTITGYKYEWDKNFISILNSYLKNETLILSKSDRINIDKYLNYQANGNGDNEMYEALDKYLGGLR